MSDFIDHDFDEEYEEEKIAPPLLEPDEVDVISDRDMFGSFNIPRIYEMGENENYDVSALEGNTATRLAMAYTATWELNINWNPLKPLLERILNAFQNPLDEDLGELIEHLKALLKNDSETGIEQ